MVSAKEASALAKERVGELEKNSSNPYSKLSGSEISDRYAEVAADKCLKFIEKTVITDTKYGGTELNITWKEIFYGTEDCGKYISDISIRYGIDKFYTATKEETDR